MSRPAAGYRLSDGTKVPGVTTIIGARKETGGLLWWANRLAYEPLGQARALLEGVARDVPNLEAIHKYLETPLEAADHNKVRDRAADAGTLAHAMVEAHLLGNDPNVLGDKTPKDVRGKADTAFLAFLEWADQTNLKVEVTELSLVSETMRVGGTLDCSVLSIGGRRSIGDFKTASAIYPDGLIQVAAYGALWLETYPERPIDGGYYIFRFDKENGDFHLHHWNELVDALSMFLLLRAAYDLDKALKKRAK